MTRVLVVGLDACDPTIATDLASRGSMPHLASMLATGGHADLLLPDGLFVGVVWPVLTRAVAPDGTNRHSWIDVDPCTYERRHSTVRSMRGTPVWQALSKAGRRSLVMDVPHDERLDDPMVTQVIEWACHDHDRGLSSAPSPLAAELTERFGDHPLLGTWPRHGTIHYAPDDYLHRAGPVRTPEEDLRLAALAEPGVAVKTDAAAWLLSERDWELAVIAFGESHAVGHQLWHVHDPSHPQHDADAHATFGSPIERTYAALDAALGHLVDTVGDDTNVVTLLSHGMGPHYDAVHLLEAVLGRLDAWLDQAATGPEARLRAACTRLPSQAWRMLAPVAAGALRRRGLRPGESVAEPELDAPGRRARRFFRSWNNDVVGGVRLNLAGREAAGRVDPDRASDLLDWLERQLRSLVDVDRGRPLVSDVYRRTERYPNATDAHLPDLFIEWHRDTPIERVWSPTVGVVHHKPTLWRTGDHIQRSMVVATGPAVTSGRHAPISATAVPAGLAALAGIELPGAVHPAPRWWHGR
jgi:predicted AlkP superfamily phosphohydrolase/phosphomutase